MRIVLATDAWPPQVNGVVRTWTTVCREIEAMGHEMIVIHPGLFKTFAAPRYPEIRLAVLPGRTIRKLLRDNPPDAIHIPTEGTIGLAMRTICRRQGWPFTSSYHTQYPQYLVKYFGIPLNWTYRAMRWFHGPAKAILTPTRGVAAELQEQGFENLVVWTRGVDIDLFKPRDKDLFAHLPRPVFLYAGRVSVEKNIQAFLDLDLPGSKVIVGDGPMRKRYAASYPDVTFAGYQFGEDLARHYAAADVFVFPSKTDTFGVVMLEANACGLPVAAYPVTGPIDVVQQGVTGFLDQDLRAACLRAMELGPEGPRRHAEKHSWRRCAEMVLENLAVIQR